MRFFLWLPLVAAFVFGCDDTCKTASDCETGFLCRIGECVADVAPPPPRPRTIPPIWPGETTGFLWQIEGSPPTYLLGTIHVGVDPDGFPPAVFAAFDASPRLAIEADIREGIDQATIDRYSMLPPELSLDQLLPAEIWQLVLQKLVPPLTEADVERLEPWYVDLLVAPAMIDVPEMEPELIQRAAAQNKPLGFLETADDQLAALAQIPREFWLADIEETLRDPNAASDAFAQLVADYLSADGDALIGLETDPAFLETLLYMRNRNWIPQIQAWHQDGGAFIAVGAAHLLGPGSVVELLRTSGSTVSLVRLDGMPLRIAHDPIQRELGPLPQLDPMSPDRRWPWF